MTVSKRLPIDTKLYLNCGEPVGLGRSDKKYCSESCPTEFHNRIKEKPVLKEGPGYIQGISEILVENHRILWECLANNDSTRIRTRGIHGQLQLQVLYQPTHQRWQPGT